MVTLPMVGDELAGYRLRGVLGRGGMSVVYEAENPRLGSTVALKVLVWEDRNGAVSVSYNSPGFLAGRAR